MWNASKHGYHALHYEIAIWTVRLTVQEADIAIVITAKLVKSLHIEGFECHLMKLGLFTH